MTAAITLEGVWKRYRLRARTLRELAGDLLSWRRQDGNEKSKSFWALSDVSFTIPRGSTFAIVGENGSGKSTALKLVAGLMHPTRGTVRSVGRVAMLSHIGAGFHLDLTGRENVFLQGAIRGIPQHELKDKLEDIFAFAECERFVDVAIKFYSAGMRLRLGFAIATHLQPDILLIDEALAVGDTAFRDRCLERILAFRSAGVTMLIVSHERYLVEQLCDRAIVLHRGETITEDEPAQAFAEYERVVRRDHPHAGSVTVQGDPDRSPLAFESLTLAGHDGESEPVLDVDEPLTLRMTFTAQRDIEGVAVGAQIAREWHVLHGTRSNRQGVEIEAREGERIVVELAYPQLGLARGGYLVHLVVMEHRLAAEPILRIKRAARFRVDHSGAEGAGLVRLRHSWRRVE